MSVESTDESAAPQSQGQLGVFATWRATSRQTKALLAGVFVSKLAGFIQIFLVLFITSKGFSSGQAGLALGIYGAGAIVGTFVGGSLSDRQSARTAMLVSMLGSAVLLISIAYLSNYLLLLTAIGLVSAVSQIYRPAAQAMITELTPPEQLVMVTAIYRLSLNLGTSVAPLLGVALASVSYDLLFWGEALAAVVYCLIAAFFLPKTKASAPAAAAGGATKQRSGYLQMLGDKKFMLFLLGFLCLHVVYIQYTAVLPLAVKAAGLSTWWYGAAIAINGAVVVTCEVWATKYVQGWSMRLSQGTGYALLAAGYGAYAIGMTPALLIIGTLLWTLSEIFGAPTVWAFPGLVAPAHLRGRYFGGLHSTYGLGSTLGPVGGIALFEVMGQRFFLLAVVVAIIATFNGQLALRVPGRPTEDEPAPTLTDTTAQTMVDPGEPILAD